MQNLVGKTYRFDDGDSITITQIKIRDENEPWITYNIQQGPGIPRKLLMKYDEFIGTYGHLFGLSEDNIDSQNQ